MVRTRRGMSAQGEPEATGDSGAQWERDFTAALSQADPEMKPQGTEKVLAAGEASPNTLEQGGAGGGAGQPQLPTASPFHSTKVKEEVELLRCRPAGLDLEQARVKAGVVSASGRDQLEPLEPNYAAAFENSMEAGPRIARVEAEYGLPGPFGNSSTDPGVAGLGFSTAVNEPAKGDQGDPQPANLGQGPSEEDGRELIPDRSLSSQAEFLLAQVMEENRALRKRLEQVELHSHSSWHSGVPGEGGVTMSPVSFTLEGGQRFVESVQPWSSLGRYVGPQDGPVGTMSTNVSGPAAARVDTGSIRQKGVSGGSRVAGLRLLGALKWYLFRGLFQGQGLRKLGQ